MGELAGSALLGLLGHHALHAAETSRSRAQSPALMPMSWQDLPYWGSWAITHFTQLGATAVLCALVLIYPFPNSDATVYLAFLLLVSAALIAFGYAASTLFSKAKVAGNVSAMLYAIAMIPG